jgi:hypothetical protein
MMPTTSPYQANSLAPETIRQEAGAGLLSQLPVGLLIVIVIIVLLLSQEDLEVGMAL